MIKKQYTSWFPLYEPIETFDSFCERNGVKPITKEDIKERGEKLRKMMQKNDLKLIILDDYRKIKRDSKARK